MEGCEITFKTSVFFSAAKFQASSCKVDVLPVNNSKQEKVSLFFLQDILHANRNINTRIIGCRLCVGVSLLLRHTENYHVEMSDMQQLNIAVKKGFSQKWPLEIKHASIGL